MQQWGQGVSVAGVRTFVDIGSPFGGVIINRQGSTINFAVAAEEEPSGRPDPRRNAAVRAVD